MEPTLQDGDLLLVGYGSEVRRGELVLVRLPAPYAGVLAVKRARLRTRHPDGSVGWWVERDNPYEGVDSATVGDIPEADVIAVVIARVWPKPTRWRKGDAVSLPGAVPVPVVSVVQPALRRLSPWWGRISRALRRK